MGICSSSTNKNSTSKNNTVMQEVSHPEKSTGNKVKSSKGGSVDLRYSRPKKDVTDQKEISINTNMIVNLATGLPLDNYIVDKKLGEGSYGTVFRVKQKDMGVFRAMKKISADSKTKEKEKEIMNEIDMLKSMDHPNIVKIFEFYNTAEGFFLITEYCKEGELFDRIIDNGPFDEPFTAYLMYQILSAVFYCHSSKIVHRDLKPENILIDSEEKDGNLNIKIIDFGTAKLFEKNKKERTVIGSAYYIAPEVLNQDYTEKCDIWSCGVIMYILLSGRPPFGGDDDEIISRIKSGKYDLKSDPWHRISPEAKDLIKRMLEFSPEARINAQKTLTHKWFKKLKTREKFTNVNLQKLKKAIENMKKFKMDYKIQEAALTFLVHNSMHLEEVREHFKIFKNLDSNQDGKLSREELSEALIKHYGIPDVEEEVDEIFRNIDNDKNGFIEMEEFIRASIDKDKILSENILKYTFNFFDKDRSGQITADELKKIFCHSKDQNVSDNLISQMMKEVDLDENKEINFEEFKSMIRRIVK